MAETKRTMFRTICGYSAVSVLVAFISAISLEILLFKSVHCKTKYKLYRVQLTILFQFFALYLDRFFWRRLSNITTNKWNVEKLWKLTIITFFVLVHVCPIYTFINTKEPTSVGWWAWVCAGGAIVLCTLMALADLMLNLLRRLKLAASSDGESIQSGTKEWLCVIVTFLYVSAAYHNATSPPIVLRHEIPIAKLPPSMSGLKIALLSDIHLSATVGLTMMKNAVEITNSLKADIVVLAGDLTDGTVEELRESALPLQDLVAPRGKFYVTGNHEYYTSDVENWMEFLESVGFHVLHNSNVKIRSQENENDWFCIFGTDDHQADIIGYDSHGVDLTKAYSGCDDKHAAVLITHQPNEAKKALDSGLPIELVLSGHTHQGQFFPANLPVYLASAFFGGLYQYDADSYVYVTQGTFYYGWPLRMFSHNEITEITIVAA